MSYPTYLPNIGNDLGEEIDAELGRARQKFPDPYGLMAALSEEVGELAKALLDEPLENVRKEAVQVAVVAIRIIQEGDPCLDPIRQRQALDTRTSEEP